MGRDSAANQSSLPPFACPSIPLSGGCNGRADGDCGDGVRSRPRATSIPIRLLFRRRHLWLWPCKVSFTYDGRTDGGTNRIAKDNDDDEGAFESPAFYRVTALRSAVGRQSANCRRIKNARKRQARPPQWRAEHGSRGSAIAVVHDSGLFGGALNYTSTFSVCPLVRPP